MYRPYSIYLAIALSINVSVKLVDIHPLAWPGGCLLQAAII
jgi:hypothetical protein